MAYALLGVMGPFNDITIILFCIIFTGILCTNDFFVLVIEMITMKMKTQSEKNIGLWQKFHLRVLFS